MYIYGKHVLVNIFTQMGKHSCYNVYDDDSRVVL